MAKIVKEQDTIVPEAQPMGDITPYYAVADGLFFLSTVYRNLHLNFDGNSKVDQFFQDFFEATAGQAFELSHKIRIESKGEWLPLLFGACNVGKSSPIREKFEGAIIQNVELQEAVSFAMDVEMSFNEMCSTIGNMEVIKNDIAGQNSIADIIESSDFRLLDLDGISKHVNS
jgi:hypothetical protein